jgi:hypothetical protein
MTPLVEDLVPDELWAMVAPLLPAPPRRNTAAGMAPSPTRACLAATVFMARASTLWRLLPLIACRPERRRGHCSWHPSRTAGRVDEIDALVPHVITQDIQVVAVVQGVIGHQHPRGHLAVIEGAHRACVLIPYAWPIDEARRIASTSQLPSKRYPASWTVFYCRISDIYRLRASHPVCNI